MVKSWLQLQPIFTIDSQRVGQLEDHGRSHWTALPNYLFAWQKFPCKILQAVGVAKSTIYKVLQYLESRGVTEKQFARGRPAVKLTKGKRKHFVNAVMDNDQVSLTKIANNLEFARFKFGECLNEKG